MHTRPYFSQAKHVVDHFCQEIGPELVEQVGPTHIDALILMIESALSSNAYHALQVSVNELEALTERTRRRMPGHAD